MPTPTNPDLETLRDALLAKYPAYAKALAKHASAAARKKALGSKVPADLVRLWELCDGAEGFFVSREARGMDFLSVADAAGAVAEMTELGVGFPKGAIPFATDGAGNYVCVDEKGAVFDWDHETRRAKQLKTSVNALVRAVASAVASGKFRDGPEIVRRPNAVVAKAMKLVEGGADGFAVERVASKLDPPEQVAIFEALAGRPSAPAEARDFLAKAYARCGRFSEAVGCAKQGRFAQTSTLHEIGQMALDASAFGDAEAAFGAIEQPNVASAVGVAIARKKAGKDAKAALDRAAEVNVPKKPIDWTSATSCYDHASVAVGKAMILAVGGDLAAARESLAEARRAFAQVTQKAVRSECLDQLTRPAEANWYGATIARHAGLG
jgi:hypothetical protein